MRNINQGGRMNQRREINPYLHLPPIFTNNLRRGRSFGNYNRRIQNFNNNNYINNNHFNKLEEITINEDIIDKSESKECNICLEKYSINEKICYLPCFHFFHASCIKEWFKKSKVCPLCKNKI